MYEWVRRSLAPGTTLQSCRRSAGAYYSDPFFRWGFPAIDGFGLDVSVNAGTLEAEVDGSRRRRRDDHPPCSADLILCSLDLTPCSSDLFPCSVA
jgi:hypothetical protein